MSAAPQDPPPVSLEPHSEYVRLERALLCADCDAIYNMIRNSCPSCGSGSALSLGNVLSADANRELVEGLRALSRLMAWAKRPLKERVSRGTPKP